MTPTPSPSSSFFAAPRTRAELEVDYSPSRFVDGLGPIVADWKARTASAKAAHEGHLVADLAYGPHARERIDFYRTQAKHAPLLVFIHGGFWQAISKEESGFIASQWTQRGIHVAVLDYVLAPEATLPEIVTQARKGLAFLAGQAEVLDFDPARIVVSGHSAGGHLAAMSQIPNADAPVVPVAGLVLVSGVFELEPIRRSHVNDKVAMSETDAAVLSPARHAPAQPVPLIVTVGENEPTAFHEQSRLQAWTWHGLGCPMEWMLIPRRHHFDMLDDLGDPNSALGQGVGRLLGLD